MTARRTNPQRAVRRGAMLMELILAIMVVGLLAVGIQASLYVAMQSVPDPASDAVKTIRANQLLERLSVELETAGYITDRSATSIGFTVPDRNGDGFPERIRYAWSAAPTGTLTRQYNGGTPVTLADGIAQFTLTPTLTTVSESYPGNAVEDSAETLLIDYNTVSGVNNANVQSNNWIGQYYTLTLPAGAYAWRPTSVRFMAKKNSSPATTLVQMRPADATLKPTSSVLEQYTLSDSALTTSYAWQSFSFSQLTPIAPGGGICLTLQWQLGNTAAVIQNTNILPGQEKSSTSGASWTYDGSHALVSQLYGKLTTCSGTQTLNSNYMTSQAIALQPSATAAWIRTSVGLVNSPELLSGRWEAKFDQEPAQLDGNGDGLADWTRDGGVLNIIASGTGVWQTTNSTLRTNPNCDFSKTTVVDVKFQNTAVGGTGATFAINALRNGANCVPLSANLTRQADGTQTLVVASKTSDAQKKTLTTIAGLPAQPIFLHMIIDATASSVSISVQDVEYGTFPVVPYASADGTRTASFSSTGSTSEFSYVRLRVME